jgi:hypothetical protein
MPPRIVPAGDIGNRISNVEFFFNTYDANGAPITLAGSPLVRVYREQSDVEISSQMSSALTVNYDSRTGMHRMYFWFDGVNYPSGFNYFVVLIQGTVDGVSMAGTVLASVGFNSRFSPLAASAISAGSIAANAFTAEKFAAGSLNGKGDWLNAVGTRTALGLTTANLDTQLGEILAAAQEGGDPWSTELPDEYTGSEAGAILANIQSKTNTITDGSVTVLSPVLGPHTIQLVKADDYTVETSNAISITETSWPDLTAADSVVFRLRRVRTNQAVQATAEVMNANTVRIELTADNQTGSLEPGGNLYEWQLIAFFGTEERTLRIGKATILDKIGEPES